MAEGPASMPLKARLRNHKQPGQAVKKVGQDSDAATQMEHHKGRAAPTTKTQYSPSSMKHPEKPSAPSRPVKPQKPRGTNGMVDSSSYSDLDTKAPRKASSGKRKLEAYEGDHEAASPLKKQKAKPKDEEKRLRLFRKKAPLSYLEKLGRATSQRMFVIDRNRGGTEEVPEETIDMAGTTGNVYSITIAPEPKCTCPDNQKGNQCKHIVYVLHQVLKAPEHLQYQLAFLSSVSPKLSLTRIAAKLCRSSARSLPTLHFLFQRLTPHRVIIARRSAATVRSVSQNLSPRPKRLSGVKLRVATTFIKTASNNG